jgi:PhnB protein
MMSISLNPYLIFNGNTKEAVHFYEKALGGKVISIMTYGDMPADPNHPLTDDMKDRVMHAHLKVGDADLMFTDNFPVTPYQPGDTVRLPSIPEKRQEREKSSPLWKTADKSSCPFRRWIGAPCTGS